MVEKEGEQITTIIIITGIITGYQGILVETKNVNRILSQQKHRIKVTQRTEVLLPSHRHCQTSFSKVDTKLYHEYYGTRLALTLFSVCLYTFILINIIT